jgi:hypothetical protein
MWSFVPDRVTLKAETLHLALSPLPHRTPDIVTRSRVELNMAWSLFPLCGNVNHTFVRLSCSCFSQALIFLSNSHGCTGLERTSNRPRLANGDRFQSVFGTFKTTCESAPALTLLGHVHHRWNGALLGKNQLPSLWWDFRISSSLGEYKNERSDAQDVCCL